MLCRRFKENCEDVFLPYVQTTNDKGEKETIWAQLIPRKVELVEFVFPEQSLPEVLKTFFPHWEKTPKNITEGYKKDFAAMGLRKAIGAQAIPKMDLSKVKPLKCRGGDDVKVEFADLMPIGIKKDRYDKNGVELL